MVLIFLPVILNYGLLSWTAPGVNLSPNPWLSFLGSYLGFMGAVSIAIANNKYQRDKDKKDEKKQKDKDKKAELKSFRSFVVMKEFYADLKLKNVKTHENSRIILTKSYEEMLKLYKDENIKTTFLKLSQYGNSPVIMNCKMLIKFKVQNNDDDREHKLEMNIGVIESGIEVFCPLTFEGVKAGDKIEVNYIEIKYTTLMNEQMRYEIDHIQNDESYVVMNDKGEPEELFKQKITSAKWSYPNKIDKKASEEKASE